MPIPSRQPFFHPRAIPPEVMKLFGDLMQVRRLLRHLSAEGPVRSCYEASSAGFVPQRLLSYDGFSCEAIAPSLIPRKPGDHRKTDRLEAIILTRLYRSGHLTAVHVPDEDHEALRRLLRLRETYHGYCTATMHRILGVLRNHGHVFTQGKCTLDQEVRMFKEEVVWPNEYESLEEATRAVATFANKPIASLLPM